MADEGYGQQNPPDSAGRFNGLNFIVDQVVSKLSTIKVVQVKSVDTASKTVSVQPMVNMTDGNSKTSEHGEIFGIPYWGWQFGKNAIQADPVVGDIGVMACADRDISAVKSTKKIGPPGSDRQMSMSDGIYFGGILNGDADQFLKFTEDGIDITLKNNNRLTAGPAGWEFFGKVKFNNEVTIDDDVIVSQAAKISGNLQLGGTMVSISGGTYSGNIQTNGEITAGTIGLKTHHHTVQGGVGSATTASQT